MGLAFAVSTMARSLRCGAPSSWVDVHAPRSGRQSSTSRQPMAAAPDVTVIGAGIAGMTAALKLLESGLSVKIIEASSGVGGKFGARYANGGYHDFAWHVLAEWCENFWDLARAIGVDKERDFASCP